MPRNATTRCGTSSTRFDGSRVRIVLGGKCPRICRRCGCGSAAMPAWDEGRRVQTLVARYAGLAVGLAPRPKVPTNGGHSGQSNGPIDFGEWYSCRLRQIQAAKGIEDPRGGRHLGAQIPTPGKVLRKARRVFGWSSLTRLRLPHALSAPKFMTASTQDEPT
jgi:hypothetical protein